VLMQLDRLLEDDLLFQQVRADLVRRHRLTAVHGRHSTPAEALLRLLAVKHLYGWSFEETERRVADSLALRWFCRVYFRRVPDDTTLQRWAHTIQPETLHALIARAAQLAAHLRVTPARKLRVDGTVVETTIHYPTDSRQLRDGVRVLTRLVQQAKPLVAERLAGEREAFRRRTRSMQRTLQVLYRQVRHRSEAAAQAAVEQRRQLYAKLTRMTEQTVQQARRVRQALTQIAAAAVPQQRRPALAQRLEASLDRFLPRVAQVVRQARTRVLEGGKVAPQEKVVSLFEPHTRVLQREKPGAPVEFGRHVVQDASGRRHRDPLPDPARGRRGAARTGARGDSPSEGLQASAQAGRSGSWLSRARTRRCLPAGRGQAGGGAQDEGKPSLRGGRWSTAAPGGGTTEGSRASRGASTACGGTSASSAAETTARVGWSGGWGGGSWPATCGRSGRPVQSERRDEGNTSKR
jgi:hypothetical protein